MEKPKKKRENFIIKFFSSIKLAISLLIALAISSIIGTIIPQGEALQFYLEKYNPTFFHIIRLLDLDNTYGSWWFISLLLFFCLNLVVCTIKRFPITLKLCKKNNLSMDVGRLMKMRHHRFWHPKGKNPESLDKALSAYKDAVGNFKTRENAGAGTLYLMERGKWSYWGLYGLHSSILIILFGAIVGIFFGYKGSVTLIEGQKTNKVIEKEKGKEIPLNFDIKLDKFFIDFYKNGAPKEYRSDVTIFNNGKEVLKKGIKVNDPLKYNGVTFYQSEFQAFPLILISLKDPNGKERYFNLSPFEKLSVPDSSMQMGIWKFLPDVHGAPAAQVWIADEKGVTDAIWLLMNRENEFNFKGKKHKISLKKTRIMYSTGLDAKKDPGVWIVWLGCTALIFGFVIVFWVPHRKVWLWLGKHEGKTMVVLSGQSNKNKIQFDRDFEKIEEAIEKALSYKK